METSKGEEGLKEIGNRIQRVEIDVGEIFLRRGKR